MNAYWKSSNHRFKTYPVFFSSYLFMRLGLIIGRKSCGKSTRKKIRDNILDNNENPHKKHKMYL